jgi:hypothetical protein
MSRVKTNKLVNNYDDFRRDSIRPTKLELAAKQVGQRLNELLASVLLSPATQSEYKELAAKSRVEAASIEYAPL